MGAREIFERVDREADTGSPLLFTSFLALAAAAPSARAILRDGLAGVDSWEAWASLEADLGAVYVGDAGPYVGISEAGAAGGLRSLPAALRREFDGELARAKAAEWAATNGATLLARDTAATKAGVRFVVQSALSGEIAERDAARALLRVQGFGLDPRREKRLLAQVAEWQAEGMSARNVGRRARKLRKKLLLQRAKAIWEYEKRAAMFEGALLAWEEVGDAGLLAPTARIIWRHGARRAGHPCPRCGALIGTSVGIQQPFVSAPVVGGGSRYNGRVLVRRRPPEHPRCDCYLRLEI